MLPEFRRRSEVVDAVTNSLAVKQYFMPTPKHCAFVECVLGEARKQTSNSFFSVRLLKKLKPYQQEYERAFFSTRLVQISGSRLMFCEDEIHLEWKYLMANFELSSGYEVQQDRKSDECS